MDPALIVIASYPKSGNTWTRIVLQGLLNHRVAGDLNAVDIGLYGRRKRMLFDEYAPAEAADLRPKEIDDLMPWVNRTIASELPAPIIIKTHEKARRNRAEEWLYPPDCVRSVICIVRHPFDVAASFASHMGYSPEKTVYEMGRPFWFAPQFDKASMPPPEFVDSWSENIESWTQASTPYPTTVLRYEDMLRHDLSCFRRVATAARIPFTEEALEHVVHASHFAKLQAQEQQEGFREKPEISPRFFRSGKAMSWEGVLTEELRSQIVNDHHEVMERYGYHPDGTTTFE